MRRSARRGMGEMKGQGYLYGKPEDAAAVVKRLGELDLLAKNAVATGVQPATDPDHRKSA